MSKKATTKIETKKPSPPVPPPPKASPLIPDTARPHNFMVLLPNSEGGVVSLTIQAFKSLISQGTVMFLDETDTVVGEFCYHAIAGWYDAGPQAVN